jgi:large subunit ribosomal protein L24
MSFSVKKGDFVKIIAGNDKGKMAQIIGIDTDKGRVALEGKDISVAKKAKKSRKANDKSGIITIPKFIAISNVMPVCASCGKTTRVRFSEVNGKKVRICECGAVLETKKVAIKEEKKAKATVRKKVKTEEKPVEANEVSVNAEVNEATIEATEVSKDAEVNEATIEAIEVSKDAEASEVTIEATEVSVNAEVDEATIEEEVADEATETKE